MESVSNWFVYDYLAGLLDSFVNPQKRVSLIYISSAIILAFFWGLFVSAKASKGSVFESLSGIFSRKIWFSKSARADILMLVINRGLMMVLSPLLLSRIAATTFLFFFFHEFLGSVSGNLAVLPVWVAPLAYTIFLFVLDDFSLF